MNTNVSGIPAPRRSRSGACEMATAGLRAAHRGLHRCQGGVRRDPATSLVTSVVRREGATAVVEIAGEIDVHTAGELRGFLLGLAGEGHVRLVADFSGVRFCDAAGLGVLVRVNNRVAEEGGSLRLSGVRPAQRRILRITGLDQLFRHYDGVEDALTT